MLRLRGLGLDLRGARNTALDEHLSVTPPPLVADALGYSYQVAFLHADAAGDAWSRYVDQRTEPRMNRGTRYSTEAEIGREER
ncbi:hypothetical protein [Arthrobacter oryzae]|uniref:hypothetical protein n=1 Tax=Arthrobacter oryzae TaxID=409290 RepID=UPI002783F591|nr:hypothetical protein [Arthrobacter oryzae]MDQ0075723.1 hypothetical protein [Arthrobacter oryzae]